MHHRVHPLYKMVQRHTLQLFHYVVLFVIYERMVSSDISGDAGTLMCNHLMYGVLHEVVSNNTNANTNGTDKNRSIPAGWIHLPALPEMAARESNLGMPSMTAELSCKAVECVIASIVASEKEGGLDIDVPIKSRLLV